MVDNVISYNVEVTRLGRPIVNVYAISIVIMNIAPIDKIIGGGDIDRVALPANVMDVQIEEFIMSGTPVVRAQLNAVKIWILDFEILESDVVSFSIEGNAIFLIQRINIDAIKNHILDRGGGDSDNNFSLEHHLFAIERGDFDGVTP